MPAVEGENACSSTADGTDEIAKLLQITGT
jgi:hypothetical protein